MQYAHALPTLRYSTSRSSCNLSRVSKMALRSSKPKGFRKANRSETQNGTLMDSITVLSLILHHRLKVHVKHIALAIDSLDFVLDGFGAGLHEDYLATHTTGAALTH